MKQLMLLLLVCFASTAFAQNSDVRFIEVNGNANRKVMAVYIQFYILD